MADLIPTRSIQNSRGKIQHRDPLDLESPVAGNGHSITEFVGLREYLAIVRRHLWLVLGILVVCVSYTANRARKEKPLYRASSAVRLIDARRAITGDMTAMTSPVPFSYAIDAMESQIQVLRSEATATAAVDLKGLRLIPQDQQDWIDEITAVLVADAPSTRQVNLIFSSDSFRLESNGRGASASYGQSAQIDGVGVVVSAKPAAERAEFDVVTRPMAVSHALSGLSAAERGKTDMIELSYVGTAPKEAQRVINAMTEAFQLQSTSGAQDLSRRRRIFLEGQLRQADSALSQATSAFTAFRSGRRVFSSTNRGGAEEAGLMTLNATRADLDAEKTTYETLLARAQKLDPPNSGSLRALVAAPGIAANPVVQQLYGELTSYERKRDSLMSGGAAPTNPDVVTISSRIPVATASLLDAVGGQIQTLEARISALDRLRASGSVQIAAAPAAESEEQELSDRVLTIRSTTAQLQSELQKAKMAEAVEAGQVQIVQLAASPGYRVPTGHARKLLIGVLVGMMLGFGAAVIADTLDRSIRKRSDIEKLLGVPGLGVIPRLPQSPNRGQRIRRALPGAARARSEDSASRAARELVTVSESRSVAAEAFRTLRTNLMFSQAVGVIRTLVVTSASPGEGKTTTASNLAVSFAQQGMRVLLIDADLRRARLHRLFEIPREPGFSDFILGRSTEEEVTSSTAVPNLYVIPSGILPPNPVELLGGERTAKCLAALTEGYDLVLLDTPPLLAASDAAVLSTVANGVMVVLRAGATDIAAAQQAVEQLTSIGARVVGAVLNDPDTQVPAYGAYYKYDYSSVEA